MYVGVGVAVERVHDLFDGWLGPEGTCLMVAWGPEGKRVANSGLLGVFPFTFFFFSETSNWPMNIQSSVQRQKYIKSSLAAPFSLLPS